ncbi:UDP glucuronosyltransferase 5 family%2C polypeptide D1 [Xyrichtys novacula]|uniref:UDP-glucuronosyltransferase n=1 Tax=Xyrichtys novacula TaxID=13765 RepID=A0AAV1FSI8_XYRNO|nr:UDP glucuronosyltransferase 5 family%2C polypeptide D1 [Xyrichtys novacula]
MGTVPLQRVCVIFVLFSGFLISFTPSCNGGNILVFPVDGSHWINMKILLEELHARGHNLTVMRASNSWYIDEKSPLYTSINFHVDVGMEDFFDVFAKENIRIQREGASSLTVFLLIRDFLSRISTIHALWVDAVARIFDDEKMVKNLLDAKYDLVLTDPAIASGVVLAKYLKLPMVLNVRWIPAGEGHYVTAPTPLSYVPSPGSGLTDKMDFIQRIKNIFFYSVNMYQIHKVWPTYNDLCGRYIEGGCSLMSLLQEADIWLYRSDFVFDFPRPTMPNVVYIGGFQCKPAQPLPADLEKFVQSAGEHGVIIMTLGTLVNALPEDLAEEFASVFAKMPQKVIWRHKGKRPSSLGNNTLIVDWMPQKDLLGHPQTKVFVAHGGTNGVQEAIYHGVPVLGIPLFFDQFDNLLRLKDRGAAKVLELAYTNSRSFEQALNEVLHQDSYRQNIQRLSRLHRDQPMAPMDQAVFWVEYVIRHKGAPHLRTEAYKMPWYSYYLLDVLLFMMTVVTVLLYSMFALFRFLCCRHRRKTKSKLH